MRKTLITLTILLTVFLTICFSASADVTKEVVIESKYKNVILFMGDGMGPNHVDAGGIYLGEPLCFDVTDSNWTYHAYSNTDSLTSQGLH